MVKHKNGKSLLLTWVDNNLTRVIYSFRFDCECVLTYISLTRVIYLLSFDFECGLTITSLELFTYSGLIVNAG